MPRLLKLPNLIHDPNDPGKGWFVDPKSLSNSSDEPQTFQLPNLPGAEDEARAVAAALHTEPVLGSDANGSVVTKGLENARVAHFATHGLISQPSIFLMGESSASLSADLAEGAIAIAPHPGEKGALALGFLSSEDLFQMKIRTELVVLSACDTGADSSVIEFEPRGLPEALLVAGARNILITLWTVSDGATENLMVQFYRNLQHGFGLSQSLRKAMLMTKRDFANVREWSAFMLIGAGR
jgi:CHAT domain-containing protein